MHSRDGKRKPKTGARQASKDKLWRSLDAYPALNTRVGKLYEAPPLIHARSTGVSAGQRSAINSGEPDRSISGV